VEFCEVALLPNNKQITSIFYDMKTSKKNEIFFPLLKSRFSGYFTYFCIVAQIPKVKIMKMADTALTATNQGNVVSSTKI
jgi:hypothetical protein